MAFTDSTDADFGQHLADNPKVVVKYYAGWCGNCRLFKPKYRRLAGDERFEGIKFLYVDAEKNPEARKTAGVNNLPYFAIYEQGELKEGLSTSKEDVVVDLISKLK